MNNPVKLARVFTAAKDSLVNGEVDRRRFIQRLGCDPEDPHIGMLVDNFLLTVKTFTDATTERKLPVGTNTNGEGPYA